MLEQKETQNLRQMWNIKRNEILREYHLENEEKRRSKMPAQPSPYLEKLHERFYCTLRLQPMDSLPALEENAVIKISHINPPKNLKDLLDSFLNKEDLLLGYEDDCIILEYRMTEQAETALAYLKDHYLKNSAVMEIF